MFTLNFNTKRKNYTTTVLTLTSYDNVHLRFSNNWGIAENKYLIQASFKDTRYKKHESIKETNTEVHSNLL